MVLVRKYISMSIGDVHSHGEVKRIGWTFMRKVWFIHIYTSSYFMEVTRLYANQSDILFTSLHSFSFYISFYIQCMYIIGVCHIVKNCTSQGSKTLYMCMCIHTYKVKLLNVQTCLTDAYS